MNPNFISTINQRIKNRKKIWYRGRFGDLEYRYE